jgi:ketosteroid isomerase-like protein
VTNAEIAARFNEAANSFDFDMLEETATEDAVFDLSRSRGPYRGVYRGYDAIRGFLDTLTDAWESVHFERVSADEVGDFVVEEISGHLIGRGSGVEVEIRGFRVYEFRDGKVSRFVLFQDLDSAREFVAAQP